MSNRECVIEILDNYLIKHDLRAGIFKSSHISSEYNLSQMREAEISLMNKRAYVVIEGEQINLRNITLPRLRKNQVTRLIADELSQISKDFEKIYFNYSIINRDKKNVTAAVYYSKEGKIRMLLRCMNGKSSIHRVHLIQFCFLKYFKDCIKCKDYIFAFVYRLKLYLICCINGRVSYNEVERYPKDEIALEEQLLSFCESCRISYGKPIKNLYISNIASESFIQLCSGNYLLYDLGYIGDGDLIKSIKGGSRKKIGKL